MNNTPSEIISLPALIKEARDYAEFSSATFMDLEGMRRTHSLIKRLADTLEVAYNELREIVSVSSAIPSPTTLKNPSSLVDDANSVLGT